MLTSTCDFIKNKKIKNPLQSPEPVLALGAIYNPAPNDVYCCQRTKKEGRAAGKRGTNTGHLPRALIASQSPNGVQIGSNPRRACPQTPFMETQWERP